MEGGKPTVITNAEGEPHHAVRRGGHRQGRAPRRAGRQAPGHHEPREHRLLDQALHGPQVRRGRRARSSMVPYQVERRRQRRRARATPGQDVLTAGDLGDDAAQAEGGRRGAPGRDGHARRHHGSRLLQRRPAAGHQGRRPDRRPDGRADRQRADRGGAGLRPRQEEGRDDRRLRLRRRHVRHLDPRGGRRRRRGQGHQRRHAPGRRRHRPPPDRLDRRRVQEGPGDRPGARTRWPCSG